MTALLESYPDWIRDINNAATQAERPMATGDSVTSACSCTSRSSRPASCRRPDSSSGHPMSASMLVRGSPDSTATGQRASATTRRVTPPSNVAGRGP